MNRIVPLSDEEILLIRDALSNYMDCLKDEMHWANIDREIVQSDQECICELVKLDGKLVGVLHDEE